MNQRRPLEGLGVLVTRPRNQQAELIWLIESAGGRAISFPTIAIADPDDTHQLRDLRHRLENYDLAIFVSANAVNRALDSVLPVGPWPSVRVAAVGQASARALKQRDIPVELVPARRGGSEDLLKLPQLQQVSGLRILIIRGEGGRELLAETLRARGAIVDYAEVYKRVNANPDVDSLMKQWARAEVNIVTATSGESLQNLNEVLGDLGRQWLRKTPLVVISERMVKLAEALGITAPILVAQQADDRAIIDAIITWRRQT